MVHTVMQKSFGRSAVILLVAAAGCFVPTPWVAFPAAAVLVLWLPGEFLLRRLTGVNTQPGQTWMAIAASFALLPVPLTWLWRFTNERYAVLGAVVAINLALLLLTRNGPSHASAEPMFSSRRARLAFTALLLWMGGCVLGAYWIPQAGGRLATLAAEDYIKHHAVLWSLDRYPLPLHNPFYARAADAPYYYYEYHHYLAAALRKLAGDVPASLAFGVTSALLAVTFIALVYLLARDHLRSEWGALFAAACVSVVGGWDVIAVALRILAGHSAPVIILDSWSPVPWRIHNLATQFFWCPQHVGALTALVLCAVWLRHAPRARWWIAIAPLAGASIFGSSVYAAMTIFLAAAIYAGLQLVELRADLRQLCRTAAAVGVIALLGAALMATQAWQYHEMSQRLPGGLTVQWPRHRYAVFGQLMPPSPLANYLDAWWIVLVDFGLPAVACVLVARRFWASLWQNPGSRLLLLAGSLGTFALFTVRSTVNPGYDYGFRAAIMPANVVAALAAGALLTNEAVRAALQRWRKPILVVGVLLGLPIGLYETPLMAARSLLLKQRHVAEVGAIRFLREHTAPDAVIQGDPVERVGLLQLTERPLGVADPDNPHVRVFTPPNPDEMRSVVADVQRAFATESASAAHELLHAARVEYVLAGDIERQKHGGLPQFDDREWFELVHEDNNARVYRLIDAAERTRHDGSRTSNEAARKHP